jgi:predicted DNA-binding transcriptional regulator AlpA
MSSIPAAEHNRPRFYRLSDVIGDRRLGIAPIIPVSKAAWYLGIKAGRYPKPVRLSVKTSAWRASDIDALVEKLNDGRWAEKIQEA